MVKIIPRYKILMQFNINPEAGDDYFQYIMHEFIPGMQSLGVYMFRAYHTAYGDYPIRLLEFLTEDMDTVRRAFQSHAWYELETKLLCYVTDFSRKTVVFKDTFQV
jgi:hypothetical protein